MLTLVFHDSTKLVAHYGNARNVIEDKDDLHNRIVPKQEPRGGAYGTTSLTSDQVLEILGKWRSPEKHWSRLALYLILVPFNVFFLFALVPDQILSTYLVDASFRLFGNVTIVFLPLIWLIGGVIYFLPAHLFVWWFDEQRKTKWISAKRKQNITAWERELDAVLSYERDLALYQQAYTEQGRDYWLYAKGVDLEDKLKQCGSFPQLNTFGMFCGECSSPTYLQLLCCRRFSCSSSLHEGYDEPEILLDQIVKSVPKALTLDT